MISGNTIETIVREKLHDALAFVLGEEWSLNEILGEALPFTEKMGSNRTEKDIDEDCHSHPTTVRHWKNAASEIKAQGKELFKVFTVTTASPTTVSRAWWPDDRIETSEIAIC